MMSIGLTGWDLASLAFKACVYAAVFAGAGGVLFLAACGESLIAADRRRVERLIGAALLLAVLLSGLRIPLLAGALSGEPAGMIDRNMLEMVLQSEEQRAALVRIVGLVLACAALVGTRSGGWQSLAVAGAALAITSFAWTGHSHALPRPNAGILLHSLHLICVAFWLGSLTPLWMIARSDARGARTAAVAVAFGRMAVAVVSALLAAGSGLFLLMLGGWETPRLDGTYASLGLGKIALVAGMLALAAYNKLRLTRRLIARDDGAARVFTFTVGMEMAFAVAVLLVTAALTTVTGPPALE